MRRVISKRIRHKADGLDLAADLNVHIEANVGRKTAPAPPRSRTPQDERPESDDPPRVPDPHPEGEEHD